MILRLSGCLPLGRPAVSGYTLPDLFRRYRRVSRLFERFPDLGLSTIKLIILDRGKAGILRQVRSRILGVVFN